LKNVVEVISSISPPPVSTAIGLGKYRIPSDLRSQAEYRLVSTTVGDHVGILGAVVFFLVMWLLVVYWVIGLLGYWVIGLLGYWVIGLLRTGGFAREFWLWSMFWEDLTEGAGFF